MAFTHESSCSAASPVRHMPTPQLFYEYPSLAHGDRSTDSLPFLEPYSCPIPGFRAENIKSLYGFAPVSTNTWPAISFDRHVSPRVSQADASPINTDHNTFASYFLPVTASYSDDIYGTRTVDPTTPPMPPSAHSSQRSSYSPPTFPEVFTPGRSTDFCIPQINIEDRAQLITGGEGFIASSPQMAHNLQVNSADTYPDMLNAIFYQDQFSMRLSKPKYQSFQNLLSTSTLPVLLYGTRSERLEQTLPSLNEQTHTPGTMIRARRPQRLITKEDSSLKCHVEGCGKLFHRKYNFKMHLETHNESRNYPFPCTLTDCKRRFVRKIDLHRHYQSVHIKQRNQFCVYCSRSFARKDTMRRHMEDSCSKRFNIEIVVRPHTFAGGDPNQRHNLHSIIQTSLFD